MENDNFKKEILDGVKELIAEQTVVILNAVDEKIEALDLKFSRKIDELTTTLDNFLKRMTNVEDGFTMIKNDLNRMKKILKEKLGVEL